MVPGAREAFEGAGSGGPSVAQCSREATSSARDMVPVRLTSKEANE